MAEEAKKGSKDGISRREFIRGTGLAVGGVAISSTVLGVACSPPTTTPVTDPIKPGATTPPPTTTTPPKTVEVIKAPEGVITLTVNNQKYVVKVEPEWSLAFVLREKLGLAGTKVGCDRAECGSCNIIVDGKAHLACSMVAIQSENRNIVTIEGLATGPALHPVQKLFLENGTFQCGYCTPGIIMAAVALLSKTPKPTLSQVREAISGNLCYCGDYTRQVNTILKGVA